MSALIAADLEIAARTIFGEARNETFVGMKAVAHVIINRYRRGGSDATVSATCLRFKQFSCWNEGDPNRAKLTSASWDDARLRTCLAAFLAALDEDDFTLGSRHYHTAAVSPSWSQRKKPALTVGAHRFFNDID